MLKNAALWFLIWSLCSALAGCKERGAVVVVTATFPATRSPNTASGGVTQKKTPTTGASPSVTPAPSTPAFTSASAPKINVLIRGCDTDLDIVNGLGEVTNAYVTVQNVGTVGLTNLEIALEANDEEKTHIDKSFSVQHLPPGYEISMRLTVDTQSGIDTSIEVVVTADEGFREVVAKPLCRGYAMDEGVLEEMGELFKVVIIRVK